jgi:IS30 family transposase
LDDDSGFRVSHETIYRYVYGPEGKRQDLYRLLPRSRRRRRGRGGRKPRGVKIPLANGIDQRPTTIADRVEFGHWEGDLVAFRQVYGKANLTSLVERKSRFAVLWRNPSRGSAGVMAGICGQLGPLPDRLCARRSRSIAEPNLPRTRRFAPSSA